ncbi:MAG: hypothetical protein GX314_00610 [Clostridiaceae bacterium]|jgi:hypothetical protein|nr:hypothetical protein [Clostridiaceae bacterium]
MAKKNDNDYGFHAYSEEHLIKRIWRVGIGRFFLLIVGFVLLILLNLLISLNKVKIFLTLIGIEVLIAFVAGWIYFFIRQRSD